MSNLGWPRTRHNSVNSYQSSTRALTENLPEAPIHQNPPGLQSTSEQDVASPVISAKPAFRPTAPLFVPSNEESTLRQESTEEDFLGTDLQGAFARVAMEGGAVESTQATFNPLIKNSSLGSIAEEIGDDQGENSAYQAQIPTSVHSRGKSDAYYPKWPHERTVNWPGPARPRSRTDVSPRTPLFNAHTSLPYQASADSQHASGNGAIVLPSTTAEISSIKGKRNNNSSGAIEQGELTVNERAAAVSAAWKTEDGYSLTATPKPPPTLAADRTMTATTEPASADEPLGDRNCEQCKGQPTHVIIPCHHTVCGMHMSFITEETSHARCAICGVRTIHVVQLHEDYADVDLQIRQSHGDLVGTQHREDDVQRKNKASNRSSGPHQADGHNTQSWQNQDEQAHLNRRPSPPNRPPTAIIRPLQSNESIGLHLDPYMPVASSRSATNHGFSSPYLPQVQHLAGDLLRADSRNSNASWSTQLSHPPHMLHYGGVPVPRGYQTPPNALSPDPVEQVGPQQRSVDQAYRTRARQLAEAIRQGLGQDPEPMPEFRQYADIQHRMQPPPFREAPTQLVPYAYDTGIVSHASAGNSDAVLQQLTCNGIPDVVDAFRHIPFFEQARFASPATWGVIRIMNIPYGTTKPEVVAFVGRNARLVQQPKGSPYFAIHIIMERSTAKTMDCFVEFETQAEAVHAVSRFQRQCMSARHPRIGDRHVEVELSGEDALMKELFPRAKCVNWAGQHPNVYTTTEPFNSGFKGFITGEEMVMTIKHAETPQRSPFSHKCLQRTYESMISTLAKYPWWAVHDYKLAERDLLFNATQSLIRALITQLRRGPNSPHLNEQLLQELVYAGLNASGFSEGQKVALLDVAGGPRIVPATLSPWAGYWPFEVLCPRVDAGENITQFYMYLLREATTFAARISLAEQSLRGYGIPSSPFGNVVVTWPADKGSLTMAQAAKIEWDTVEELLRRVCPVQGVITEEE